MSLITTITFLSVLFTTSVAYQRWSIPSLNTRITDGQPANIRDHPWNVQIYFYGIPFCAGAIISPIYIVTNAQCTYQNPPNSLIIHAGSAIYGFGGVYLGIIEYFQHPKFEYYSRDYDISILVLAEALQFSDNIAPARLPVDGLVLDPGTEGIVSGWGRVNATSTLATHLQEITMTTITLSECRSLYSSVKVRSRHFCTLGQVACAGDVGSPFVINGVIIGLVSWGNDCGTSTLPVVLTNVAYFRDYIREITGI
ncbi:hypothetical protein Trydic_g5236 [Trypoxylus dichotomus]